MYRKSKPEFEIDLPQFSPFELILAEARYIILYGEINEESAKEINTKLIAMSIKNPKRPIFLEINSTGGMVSDGIAIMNTIQTIPAHVVTLINGEACSMAGLISVVGDERIIAPNSYWMGHPMEDAVMGTAKTIKDRGVYLEKLESDLRKVFSEKTKLTDIEFEQMLRGELWLNSQDCLAKGIVDNIQVFQLQRPTKDKNRKKSKK
jgi:ATP-dependent Clp protease protease subunit